MAESASGGGVSAPGRVSAPRGVSAPWVGVCSWGCLLQGVGVCSGGCLLPEGVWYPSMHWGRHPPREQNDKQVQKYYLGHNFVEAGKNVFSKWMRASQIWRFLKVTYECSLICCVKLSISDSQKIQPIENPFSIFLWDDGFPINFPGVNDRHFIDEEWGWGIHQPGWGSFSWLCRYT